MRRSAISADMPDNGNHLEAGRLEAIFGQWVEQ